MDVPMSLVECAVCHIPFTMSADLNSKLRRCHNTFYCPVGHTQSYTGKSDLEKMREERDTALRLQLAAQTKIEALEKKKSKSKKR